MIRSILLCLLLYSTLLSCNSGNVEHRKTSNETIEGQVELKYTSLFSITKFKDFTEVVIKNPWNLSETYATYALVPKENDVPEHLPENSILIRTPVDNMVTLASPHVGMFELFDAEDKICAVGAYKYIYNQNVQDRIKLGKVDEVGSSQNLNIELLIDLDPDIVMATGNQQIHDNLKLVSKYGIPVVYIIEWMEQSPLARAEWLKFAAVFIDESEKAEEIFNEIESAYLKTAEIAKTVRYKPKVLLGKKFKGTWYMSGGKSYFAQYLKDAGADYYWFSDTATGSLPLSFEDIVDKQMDADIWLNPGTAMSISEILSEDDRYSVFKALQDKNVYNRTKSSNDIGANAYWESGPVNPHITLADLIKILHPALLPNHELVYYQKLQ